MNSTEPGNGTEGNKPSSAPEVGDEKAFGGIAEAVYRKRWHTLAVLNLALVIIVVANSVLTIALPTLVRELGASAADLQWIIDAYAIVFGGLLLTMGAVGDRYDAGRPFNGDWSFSAPPRPRPCGQPRPLNSLPPRR